MSEANASVHRGAPEFEVFHPREKPAPWMKVGVAFENNDGSLSVLIDYVPAGAGQLRLNLRKKKPKAQNVRGDAHSANDADLHIDDDVPQPAQLEASKGMSGARGGQQGRGGRAR